MYPQAVVVVASVRFSYHVGPICIRMSVVLCSVMHEPHPIAIRQSEKSIVLIGSYGDKQYFLEAIRVEDDFGRHVVRPVFDWLGGTRS